MKRIVACILILCLTAVFSLSSCKKVDEPNIQDAPGVDITEGYDEAASQYNISDTVSAMEDLKNTEEVNFVRGITTPDALMSALDSGKDEFIKLGGCQGESIDIPDADYKDVTLIVDVPEAALAVNASFKAVSVYSVTENGIAFSGHAETFAVFGENVSAHISGTVNTVYIEGKNCVLTISGKCETVVNMNTTTEIINSTENDITVTTSTGGKVVVPAGGTLLSN